MKQERKNSAMHRCLVVALMMHLTLAASSSQSPYITVPALGRIGHFGYLYNEQTGELRSSSVFRTSNFPSTSIVTTELHSTSTEAEVTNTFAEKLQLLNIDANTGANILSGLVKVRGSARILKDQQTYDEERTGTGILLYHHQTVDQDLQMFSDALKELYNKDLLNHKEATHFVSGITWGLNAAVTFKGIATQHKSKIDIRRELEETFDALREHSVEIDDSKNNFSTIVYSDIALPIGENPRTRRELQEIRNQIPQAISNTNDGKGVPIQYKLTPISALRNYLNVLDRYNVFARHISDSTLGKFFPVVDEISSAEQQLKNVQEKLQLNAVCVHQDTTDQINELNLNFTEFKNNFQELFATTLLSVRTGNGTKNDLLALAKSLRLSAFVGTRMRSRLSEFKNALDKVDFCSNLKNLNPEIEYFGAVDDLKSKIFQNRDKTIFALFYKYEFIQNNAAVFDDHLNIFLGFMNRPNSKLFAVNCDFNFGLCECISNTTIKQFVNGVITSLDFVQETEAQETKLEEQIRQLNEKYEAVQKILITTVDEFQKNQSKLEEQITQVTSTINSISSRFVDSDDFKAHRQLINTTVTAIQNTLKDSNTHQIITNATVSVFEDTLEGFNATVQELRKHLGNFTAQQRNVVTNVGEIQNNVDILEQKLVCVLNPCLNSGRCSIRNNERHCECSAGFMGDNCETNIDDCAGNNRCQNGGTCEDGVNKFTCACPQEFFGNYCEHRNECVYPGTCASVSRDAKCKCREGYVTDPVDSRKCKLENDSENATLIFGSSQGIEQFSLSQQTVVQIQNYAGSKRALDVMYRTNTMFWGGWEGTMYTAPIREGASKTVVLSESGSYILCLAVDWVYNHVYYVDHNKNKLSVANLDGTMIKVLFTTGITGTHAVVVNPLNGWIYWANFNARNIERAGSDGSKREVIANTSPNHPLGIALDLTQNRLYWTTYSSHPCSIHSMNPDGSDLKLVYRATQPTFSSSQFWHITIFVDDVYWRDASTSAVYKTNKCGGGEATKISAANSGDYYNTIEAFHFSKQPEGVNYCENRTAGQCSHLCFPTPSTGNENTSLATKCACPDGLTLSSNQLTCT